MLTWAVYVHSLPEEDECVLGSPTNTELPVVPWVPRVTPVAAVCERKPWSHVRSHMTATGGSVKHKARFQSLSDLRLTEEDVKRRRSVFVPHNNIFIRELDNYRFPYLRYYCFLIAPETPYVIL